MEGEICEPEAKRKENNNDNNEKYIKRIGLALIDG